MSVGLQYVLIPSFLKRVRARALGCERANPEFLASIMREALKEKIANSKPWQTN